MQFDRCNRMIFLKDLSYQEPHDHGLAKIVEAIIISVKLKAS